jgi:Spy/CpxP family protein refolding chaperone
VKTIIAALAFALLLPATSWAQGDVRNAPPTPEQRAALEARVIQRFIQQTSEELGVSVEVATRLNDIFRENMAARRRVARTAGEVRQRLQHAVETESANDAQYARMLDELEALRVREHELALAEQAALAALLTPRQRAILTVHWLRMQDNMREVMLRRGGQPQQRRP